MTYRPEIDGLRAIAVLAVVFFHAGIAGFSGGFVGVDVFFVISGFLITSLIVKDLNNNEFSFLGFWERRARRILPAAFFVMAVVLVFGWFLILPDDFTRLGSSVIAQSVFTSNIFFWREAGYFGPTADQTPLLHMWSLSVEEQFYLAFPLVMVIITRLFLPLRVWLLLAAAAVSLTISIAWSESHPDAAFYLPVTRAWELLMGALLGIWAMKGSTAKLTPLIRDAMTLIGLALIGVSVYAFDQNTIFPGYTALVPTLGAASFIAGNTGTQSRTGRLIATKPLVWIGLLSYSLYLWHWPMLVFANNWLGSLSATSALIVILVSVIVAYASYRWVETPFRTRRVFQKRRQVFAASAVAMTVAIAIGFLLASNNGFAGRIPSTANQYLVSANTHLNNGCTNNLSPAQVRENELCLLGSDAENPTILLWGDSHAGSLEPVFHNLGISRQDSVYLAEHSSCPPIIGIRRIARSSCDEFNDEVLEAVTRLGITDVVLSASWSLYVDSASNANLVSAPNRTSTSTSDAKRIFDTYFLDSIETISEHVERVWIVTQVPTHEFLVPQKLAMLSWRGGDPETARLELENYHSQIEFIGPQFDLVKALDGVALIDVEQTLCDESWCFSSRGNEPLYFDNGHLSAAGSIELSDSIIEIFEAANTGASTGS